MSSFPDLFGSSPRKPRPPKQSKQFLFVGSIAAIAVVLLFAAIKLKASPKPTSEPTSTVIKQASMTPPVETPSAMPRPVETTPIPPSETTPVTPSDPSTTTEPTPAAIPDQTPDTTSDTTPNQPSDSPSNQAPGVELAGMTINPGSVYAGDAFTIEVTLSAPAPAGGASVDLSLGDAVQDPIDIPEGETSGSVSYHAGSNSGTDTFTCTYGGVTYNTDLTVMDIPDCMDAIDDDDTPCTDAEGNTSTHGEWKEREQQQMNEQEQMRERVNDETNP